MNQTAMRLMNACAYRHQWVFAWRTAGTNFSNRRHQVTRHVVMPAVITTLHDNDVIPRRVRPGGADRLVRRFTARVHNTNLVGKGNGLANQVREFAFHGGRIDSEKTGS